MPYQCTEEFLFKHVRNLATGDIENTQEDVARYAGVVFQARAAELDREHPNTVMFIYPTTLGAISQSVVHSGLNSKFTFQGRIPWVVTWKGVGHYQLIRNAAGFQGNTNGNGQCARFSGVTTDANSQIINWVAPG